MLLLILTTYTYILLLLSNNKPLFAEVRVLVHGRSNTIRALNIFQNMQGYISNGSNNISRTEQKNYSAALFLRGTTSALNVMIPGLIILTS